MIIQRSYEKLAEHEELASAASAKKAERHTCAVDPVVQEDGNEDENEDEHDYKSEDSDDEAISLTHSQRALLIKALNGALDDDDESVEDVLDETLGINTFAIKHVGGSNMELCASISRTITGSFFQSSGSQGEEDAREARHRKKEEAMKNEIRDIIRQFQKSKRDAPHTKEKRHREKAKKNHKDADKSEAIKKEIKELLRHIQKSAAQAENTKNHGEEDEDENDEETKNEISDSKSEIMRREVKELLRRIRKSKPQPPRGGSVKSQIVTGIHGVETILRKK